MAPTHNCFCILSHAFFAVGVKGMVDNKLKQYTTMICCEQGDMAQALPDGDRTLWEWMKVRLAAGRGSNVNANRSEQWRARDRATTTAISL
jgi:hypothetical protein